MQAGYGGTQSLFLFPTRQKKKRVGEKDFDNFAEGWD